MQVGVLETWGSTFASVGAVPLPLKGLVEGVEQKASECSLSSRPAYDPASSGVGLRDRSIAYDLSLQLSAEREHHVYCPRKLG